MDIPKGFKPGDFVKLFGQERKSIDENGKEHKNVKILSSKLLKAKEQVNISKSKNKQSDKNQHEKVNGTISPKSILGVIQEFKEEEKAKLIGRGKISMDEAR